MATEDPYLDLGRLLAGTAQRGWEWIELRVSLGPAEARFRVEVKYQGRGTEPLLGLDPEELVGRCRRVQDFTASIAPTGERWRAMLFKLDQSGQFDTKFKYEP